jgi:hypothetical protein
LRKTFIFTVLILLCLGSKGLFAANEVPDKAQDIQPLLPGMKVPSVVFTSVQGTRFDLLKEAARQPLVLIFYRGGW